MGNGVGKLTICFNGVSHRRKEAPVVIPDPLDDLGHSFCYVRPDQSAEETTFRSISGAAVSANTATPLSTSVLDIYNAIDYRASAFESSTSFTSIPLQPMPRNSVNSGPLYSGQVPYSGPVERGFLSGPIECGFQSGPLFLTSLSGSLEKGSQEQFPRSCSQRSRKQSLMRVLRTAISRTFVAHNPVAPVTKRVVSIKQPEWTGGGSEKTNELTISSANLSSESSFLDDDECFNHSQNLQWACGKAGEDRVQVVVSEEHGWVFVGIYDGFNGPDAPDFLSSNLYQSVYKELKGLLWDDSNNNNLNSSGSSSSVQSLELVESSGDDQRETNRFSNPNSVDSQESYPSGTEGLQGPRRKKSKGSKSRHRVSENTRWWKCEFNRERLELDRRLKEYSNSNGSDSNHSEVLKALSRGLKKTEESFLDIADQMLVENPELALMGSCVLVMLMKGEDVYVMNVGDSRAVLAQKPEPDLFMQDLERITEETLYDLEDSNVDNGAINPSLTACQLSIDHSTSVAEEVQRIKSEHVDDPCAVMNDRVKGSLKVTRAFGAGYLKKPKWNNALLEMFQIDYVGTSPYLNCVPHLHHHKLGPRDQFLILSSDGLYQYFTNEEAVSEVELFIQWSPEGDPAQHLVEEVLFRAAKKAGLDFHELLEIPQGDRRRYHDDVSVIVISLEGRIWRSSV
ncbi:putative protein phosphatase 2C 4 [Bidens hawaiensis]|uniref:putative protein phosphatase 2C 4 n=1 Tax=Bidens hawaiensis TaxID=980011 RepID=UPI00404A7ECF